MFYSNLATPQMTIYLYEGHLEGGR